MRYLILDIGYSIYERFAEEENIEVYNPVALLNLVEIFNRKNLDLALQDPSTLTILKRYASYEDRVRNGHLGKTATFWLNVIEYTRLILMLQYSVKNNGHMADLFFAYDGPNYSR